MSCFSGCCCASCKDEHAKSIEAAKEWTSFTQSNYTCLLILSILSGPGVVIWAGCLYGKGCAQFCCLFLLMTLASVLGLEILGHIWAISWVLNLREAGVIKE